ncbi:hypothetical protein GJ688_02905 [Heliobacillus mobilis]|uniref:Uncharacterized protein n=1 Tax=Heliobacterium mobile TaxID=28064 RepID=A0A6I3SGG9_HELMO|nr:hypothetical protein [Heliobacterium mobile]MTV47931.1 hypothetical protein [Heliobacterium mobile]
MNVRSFLPAISILMLSPTAAWADGPLKDPIAQQVDVSGKIIVPLLAVSLLLAVVARFSKNGTIYGLHRGLGLIAGLGVFGHAIYALMQMGFDKPVANATGMIAAMAIAVVAYTGFQKSQPAIHRLATLVVVAGFIAHKVVIS